MTREREELLALVRHAEDPTQADEERVLRALREAVATGPSSRARSRQTDRHGLDGLPKLAPAAFKLGGAAGALAAVAAGVYLLRAPAHRDAPPTAARTVTTPTVIERAARETAEPTAPEPPSPAPPAADASLAPPEAAAEKPARTAAVPVPALRREIALLARVQAALRRGDGTAALRALEAHHTTDRTLLAERQAARILAFCLIGDVVEARRAARQFGRQHPDSPQRAAIERSCANSR